MTPCIEFQGCKDREGYGKLRYKTKYYRAHRFVWEQLFGRIPLGLLVCHWCDNPPCVNPKHLFLGTNGDNVRDMWRKGRESIKTRLMYKFRKSEKRDANGRFAAGI